MSEGALNMNDIVTNSSSKKGGSKLRKGLWSPEEDEKLMNYMLRNGQGCWSDIARNAELQRCGKSCRLRWINYLRPDLKRGAFSSQEEDLILRLHSILGNRWSQIAARLPGRTDNEIKNFWNSTIKKRLQSNNSLESISSPDGSISSFDPADIYSGGASSTQEKYDLMTMSTELLPFSSSFTSTKKTLTPFHFQFDPSSQSDYRYTDQNGACANSLFNMEPIYFDQIDLVTDKFDVGQGTIEIDGKLAADQDINDDQWNMEFKHEADENYRDHESVVYTSRSRMKNCSNVIEEDMIYGNTGEQWPGESLKMGKMWDMEELMDYASCSSNPFPCENLPQSR